MEVIKSHLEFLQQHIDSTIDYLRGDQDSLKRFIFCAIEKLQKNIVSIRALYNLYDEQPEHEFALGVLLRSLLMDAILCQYLRYFTLREPFDYKKVRDELMSNSLKFLADGTNYIVQDLLDFNPELTGDERKAIFDAVQKMFPGVFDEKNNKLQKKAQYSFQLKQLYINSEHPLMYSKKEVYKLYANYSKYDHLSHWTSLLGKKSLTEKKRYVDSSIVMVLYNYRDLWAIAHLDEHLLLVAQNSLADIDAHMHDSYPDIN